MKRWHKNAQITKLMKSVRDLMPNQKAVTPACPCEMGWPWLECFLWSHGERQTVPAICGFCPATHGEHLWVQTEALRTRHVRLRKHPIGTQHLLQGKNFYLWMGYTGGISQTARVEWAPDQWRYTVRYLHGLHDPDLEQDTEGFICTSLYGHFTWIYLEWHREPCCRHGWPETWRLPSVISETRKIQELTRRSRKTIHVYGTQRYQTRGQRSWMYVLTICGQSLVSIRTW